MLHWVPFQCSASVWLLLPTLQMSLPLTALTAYNVKGKLGPELSPGTCTQDAPFHLRSNTCPSPPVAVKSPTAQTLFVASAATPSRRLLFALGFGLETT